MTVAAFFWKYIVGALFIIAIVAAFAAMLWLMCWTGWCGSWGAS